MPHEVVSQGANERTRLTVNRDLTFGAVLLAMATVTFVVSPGWGSTPWFFPNVIAAAMVLFGVSLVVRGVLQRRGDALFDSARHLLDAVVWIAITIGYIALLDIIGYVASTFTFFLVALGWLSDGSWLRRILITGLGALTAVAALSLVFGIAFNVPLPSGG